MKATTVPITRQVLVQSPSLSHLVPACCFTATRLSLWASVSSCDQGQSWLLLAASTPRLSGWTGVSQDGLGAHVAGTGWAAELGMRQGTCISPRVGSEWHPKSPQGAVGAMGEARVWLVVMDPPRELQKDSEVKLKDLKDKNQDGTQVSDLPEMGQQGWGARSGVHLGGGARHSPLCPQSQ